MRSPLIRILFLLILFMAGGCASVRVAMYNKSVHYPATDPRTVEIFQKKPADRQFTEIGEIDVEGATTMDQVERIFRAKAAQDGGDAVYIYNITQQQRTFIAPHECHYEEGDFYPHGRLFAHEHYYPVSYGYFPRYYYCYGYNDVETTTYLNAVGIIIRYTQ